ncbi:MAG: hypothetical protein JW797_17810 [Bradymonadales bacterium]|nr:hypothetical protein [Bradymonadales bacterium]
MALVAAVLVALPATAGAVEYYSKINEIITPPDGRPVILATVLDSFGQAPPLADFEYLEVSFGQANRFSGNGLKANTFLDSGRGTDYALVLPGYEGFGVNYVVAAAEGAGWFQTNRVAEEGDSCAVFVYGDGVLPHDGNAAELVEKFRDPEGIMARIGRPYMLSALDEAILHLEPLPLGRRRVIILVGSGLDVRLGDSVDEIVLGPEATADDYARAYRASQRQLLQDHQAALREYLDELRRVNARVYTIGFNETRPDYLEVLQVLARKTGGTHRVVYNIGALSAPAGAASGGAYGQLADELTRELVLEPSFTVEPGREYEVVLTVRFPEASSYQVITNIESRPYYLEVQPQATRLNIIPYLIAAGIILVVVAIGLVILFFMLGKMKVSREEIKKRKKLQEVVDKGKAFCPKCNRKMQPEWDHCLFCASGLEPLEEVPEEVKKAEEAQKALDEMDGKTQEDKAAEAAAAAAMGTAAAAAHWADRTGQRICPKCHRVMAKDWKECMFCAAGMEALPEDAEAGPEEVAKPVPFGPGGAPPQAAAPPSAKKAGEKDDVAKTVAITPGKGVCPVCGRPVPKDWTECLYCKAGI